jgi:hypothetical protein
MCETEQLNPVLTPTGTTAGVRMVKRERGMSQSAPVERVVRNAAYKRRRRLLGKRRDVTLHIGEMQRG